MKKINRPISDIRTIKLFGFLLLLVVSLTSAQASFAQESQGMEVAEAFVPKDKGTATILRYKGMPELNAPLPELNYPERAVQMGVEGRVIVSYTIDENGEVLNAVVKRGIGYGCDEEALRVIKKASFKPVLNDQGKPIAMTFISPIVFRLQ